MKLGEGEVKGPTRRIKGREGNKYIRKKIRTRAKQRN